MEATGKAQKRLKSKMLKKQQEQAHHDAMAGILNKVFGRVSHSRYIIHCGATNSGKTYNALMALKQKETGVYLAPLRLLAWEIYDKLIADGYSCDLITGEEQIVGPQGSRFTSSTIEMLDCNKAYDIAVIDEAFMVGDRERGKAWTKAILDVKAEEVHIIVNPEALQVVQGLLTLTGRKYEVKKYEMLSKFRFAEHPVFFTKSIDKGGVFITFSRVNVLIAKMQFRELGLNAGVLYGNLPPEVKRTQIQGFINGEFDVMVCTDVIGMGLNLPCNYLVFLDIEKYDGVASRQLSPTEVRQIAGRTGRYGLSADDCFVSANGDYKLRRVRELYAIPDNVHKAYVGFDFEMFSSFPVGMSINDRVSAFQNIQFIPEKLRSMVFRESVARYFEIASLVDKKAFTLDVKWILLTAPIKNNNKTYFSSIVAEYARDGIMRIPKTGQLYDIKEYEDKISEIELYLNLSRSLNHQTNEKVYIREQKELLVNRLSEMLLDKKLAAGKKCKLCSTMLELTYPYPYCGTCYNERVRRRWDDDDFHY